MKGKDIASVGIFILVLIGTVAGSAYLMKPKLAYPAETLEGLAKALSAKQITMYGAEWCPHCKAEKARFGDAWKYAPYVECPENEQLCLAKGVRSYPTWIAPDGTSYEGEQGIEKLAEIADYELVK